MTQNDEPRYDRMDADSVFHTKMSPPRQNTICLYVAVFLVGVVAVIALLFSAIALARPGSITATPECTSLPSGEGDDKIWVFATGHDGSNLEYIHDLTGTMRGFHIDIVEAVCAMANKNCRMMWDIYENCYTSKAGERPRPGVGLVSQWYDGCTGWYSTFERSASVSFTKPFRKPVEGAFFVRRGNPANFDSSDITGKTIGFLDGGAANEFCLEREKLPGAELPPDKIRHFTSRKDIIQAVNTQTVDAVFSNVNIYDLAADLDIVAGNTITTCMQDGAGIMVRMDSHLPDWWNPAFDELKRSSEYRRICSEVTEKHGAFSTKEVACID